MTKQEIKDLIAAKIAGQGTMVDVGGGLPTILNEIIDLIPAPSPSVEPLIVEGSFNSGYFTPNAGQPSWADAKAAFDAHIDIFLVFKLSDIPSVVLVTSSSIDDAGDKFLTGTVFDQSASEYISVLWNGEA